MDDTQKYGQYGVNYSMIITLKSDRNLKNLRKIAFFATKSYNLY